jgi:hypothetical protein
MHFYLLAEKTTSNINNIISPNSIQIDSFNFIDSVISLFFAFIFGWLISNSYKYSSGSIYGGRQINSSILPLTLTVCVIITVVKSSLALSLGLVGALSIVRFRTPIKDPEDLIYLFLAIVAGLGFGSNQNVYTAIGIGLILFILAIRSFIRTKRNYKLNFGEEFNLNIEWDHDENLTVSEIIDIVSRTSSKISLIRFDKLNSKKALILQISLKEKVNIETVINDISNFKPSISTQIFNASMEY